MGSYTHGLAKYLSDILKPLINRKFTVKDSFSFVHELLSVRDIPFMCSFDVVSLYTNIPVDQTIEICLNKLYKDNNTVNNITREQMKRLLHYCVKLNHFMFDNQYYDQKDGVAMGSSLGPILADIFMSDLENKVFDTFDGNLPLLYKRYVDDIFLVFNDRDDCELFYEYINRQHPNIKFTLDIEENECLPFLDVLVSRSADGVVSTSLYRKDTFSGLMMQYDSFVPVSYKKSLVNGLIHRAWKICSSSELFQSELTYIKRLLLSNGFPLKFINRQIKLFLNKKQAAIPKDIQFGPVRRKLYISLPFSGQNSIKLSRQLNRVVTKLAPCVSLNLVFTATNRLNCISKLKSPIPILNKSNVIYQINCLECQEFYVGLTTRRLCKRLYEHKNRNYSAIYKHSSDADHKINYDNPKVLASDTIKIRLQVKETLLIKDLAAYKSLNVNIDSFECKLW